MHHFRWKMQLKPSSSLHYFTPGYSIIIRYDFNRSLSKMKKNQEYMKIVHESAANPGAGHQNKEKTKSLCETRNEDSPKSANRSSIAKRRRNILGKHANGIYDVRSCSMHLQVDDTRIFVFF